MHLLKRFENEWGLERSDCSDDNLPGVPYFLATGQRVPEPGPTKTPVFIHSGCEPHDGPSAVQKQAQAIFSDVQSIHPASTAG